MLKEYSALRETTRSLFSDKSRVSGVSVFDNFGTTLNPCALICFHVRLFFPPAADFYFSPLSALERWSCSFTLGRCAGRVHAVAIATCRSLMSKKATNLQKRRRWPASATKQLWLVFCIYSIPPIQNSSEGDCCDEAERRAFWVCWKNGYVHFVKVVASVIMILSMFEQLCFEPCKVNIFFNNSVIKPARDDCFWLNRFMFVWKFSSNLSFEINWDLISTSDLFLSSCATLHRTFKPGLGSLRAKCGPLEHVIMARVRIFVT